MGTKTEHIRPARAPSSHTPGTALPSALRAPQGSGQVLEATRLPRLLCASLVASGVGSKEMDRGRDPQGSTANLGEAVVGGAGWLLCV